MTAKEKQEIRETIESEGFDYAFTAYSDFDEVKDPKFHQLRQAYLAARKALAEYIGYEDE
ncbi:MAG: hypothetical protein AAB897_02580 [Patescibacteria group bacterium]